MGTQNPLAEMLGEVLRKDAEFDTIDWLDDVRKNNVFLTKAMRKRVTDEMAISKIEKDRASKTKGKRPRPSSQAAAPARNVPANAAEINTKKKKKKRAPQVKPELKTEKRQKVKGPQPVSRPQAMNYQKIAYELSINVDTRESLEALNVRRPIK